MRFRLTLLMILTMWLAGWCENVPTSISELRRMCTETFRKRDYQKAHDLALELREASLKEKNELGLGNAIYCLGATEIYLGNPDSALVHLNEALRIAEKNRNDSLKGLTLNCLGIYETTFNLNYSVAQYYFIRSLDYPVAEEYAYINLAQIALLQNDTSGVEYARRTYEHGRKTNDIHSCYISLLSLIKFAMLEKDFDTASDLLNQMKDIAAKYEYADLDRLKLLEADILSHTGHIAESNNLLDSIHDGIETKYPSHLPTLLYLKGKNLYDEKKYAASNKLLTEAMEAADKIANTTSLIIIYKLIADNYAAMGLDSRALPYMRQALELSETSAQADRQRMINERKLVLDVIHQEQKSQLAEEKARYNGRLSFFLGLLLVLAAATIIIVILNLRRRNRLYRHIVQQNVTMLENEEKYKARIKELEICPAMTETQAEPEPDIAAALQTEPNPSDTSEPVVTGGEDRRNTGTYTMPEEKSKRLFSSLQALMEDEKLYRNPQLTRETVMDILKTNSTYLAQVIKDNAGMNYSQYVNSFRMREALKALSDRTRIEVPIKDIALESGFNSLTTFYKLFQQATGISPTAYRRSLASIA